MKIDNRIPITNPMGFEIEFLPPNRLEIHAPLNPNVNDKGNVFAGSIYSSLVLAPWYLLSEITQAQGVECKISVFYSTVKFRSPVEKDFTAYCEISDCERIIVKLRENGHYKFSASAYIEGDDRNHACTFQGKYFLRVT